MPDVFGIEIGRQPERREPARACHGPIMKIVNRVVRLRGLRPGSHSKLVNADRQDPKGIPASERTALNGGLGDDLRGFEIELHGIVH